MTPGATRSIGARGLQRALAVDRVAERVDDAAEQFGTDRHFKDAARRLDGVAFADALVVAEDDRADRVLLEVQREAEQVARELDHFAVADIGQAVDAADAVRDRDDGADVAGFGSRFELADALLDQLADF
jgi:hypothetical protein